VFLLFKIRNNNKQFLIISFILCLRRNYLSRVENYEMLRRLTSLIHKMHKLRENCDNCKFRDVNLDASVILKIKMRQYRRLRKDNNKIDKSYYNFLIKHERIVLLSLLIIL